MKYYGKVGYIETTETSPGVYEEVKTEGNYYGDVLKNTKRWQGASKVNDDLEIKVQISIVADPYAYKHFYAIRYVEYMNQLWKVTSVEPQFPRLILDVGGVYNG